jgi:hypothetical protein
MRGRKLAPFAALMAAVYAPSAHAACLPGDATVGSADNCRVYMHDTGEATEIAANQDLVLLPNETYVFQATINEAGVPAGPTCPAECPLSGRVACESTTAAPCPAECFCASGSSLNFVVTSPVNVSASPSLVMAISETAPAAGSASSATDAYHNGEWTISGKRFNTVHAVNVGMKGHAIEEFNMVELCYPAWVASLPSGGGNSLAASKADAECNCADCGSACGLTGSRKSTTCDDVECCSYSSGCSVGLARCTAGGGTHHQCDGAMCGNQLNSQVHNSALTPNFNCTAYAQSPDMMAAAMFASYCCDVTPTAMATAVDAKMDYKDTGVFFATGLGPVEGDELSQSCDLDSASPTYGYETAFAHPQPKLTGCQATDIASTTTPNPIFYVYVLNTGNESVTLGNIFAKFEPLTTQDTHDCADDASWVPVASGGGRATAPLLMVLLLLLVAVRWM